MTDKKRADTSPARKMKDKIRADYSLTLENLRIALYYVGEKEEDNPYTGAGSVFYFDKNADVLISEDLCEEIFGEKINNLLLTDFFDYWFDNDENQKYKDKTKYSFLPFQKYKLILNFYRKSRPDNEDKDQIQREYFWMTHLACWKYKSISYKKGKTVTNIYSPDRSRKTSIFKCTEYMPGSYGKQLKKDLEKIWYYQINDKFYSTLQSLRDDGLSVDAAEELIVASEYIVMCNHQIISNYCIPDKKRLLKKVISDFAKNIYEYEGERAEKSLLPENSGAVTALCECLKDMMEKIGPEAIESEKNDWILARALSWLVIGAMLRNSLSKDLIEKYLVPYMLKTGTAIPEEPWKKYLQEDDDSLIDNFQVNEDEIFGLRDQIQLIRKMFDMQGSKAEKSRIVYIQGIGGVGKSTLAKEFAKTYSQEYDTIIEVSAPSAKDAVILMGTTIPENINYQARLQRIAKICKKKKLLLIVHDYNRPEDKYYGDWYKICCDIILTGWYDKRGLGIKTLHLETNDGSNPELLAAATDIFQTNYLKNAVLSNDEYLQRKLELILDEENDSVRKLCAMTGCHPLTIKVMAMQSACTPGIEVRPKDLLKEMREQKTGHFQARNFSISKDGIQHIYGDALTHLKHVFEKMADERLLSEGEFSCLRNMTLIPYAWGISADRYAEWTGEEAEYLSSLTRKGWLEYEVNKTDILSEGKGIGVYRMPMAIASVLSHIDKTTPDIASCLMLIKSFMDYAAEIDGTYLVQEVLASEAETIAIYLSEEISEDYAFILSYCASLIYSRRTDYYRLTLVKKICLTVLNIRIQVLGEEDPYTADSYEQAGICFDNLGDLKSGLEYKEKALEIRLRVLGEKHKDTAVSYNNVGSSYWKLGEKKKGVAYKEKALDIRLDVLGEKNPETALSYNDIGIYYIELGDLKKGLSYQEKALEIERHILGDEHRHTAASYTNVGLSYWDNGDRDTGLKYLEKGLEIRLRVSGEEHPDTAISYSSLGGCYFDIGEYEKALACQKKALEIDCRVFGEEHPNTVMAYENVGNIYFALGNYQKSCEYLERLLDIRRRLLGEIHPDITETYEQLSFLYWEIGDEKKSLEYMEHASLFLPPDFL